MVVFRGKFESKTAWKNTAMSCLPTALFFFLTELFAWSHLRTAGMDLWPLVFGFVWAILLSGLLYLLHGILSRILFGLLFVGSMVYSVGQTGYYLLFGEILWVSEFRYASEGADYLDIILNYPPEWFLEILLLLVLGIYILLHAPEKGKKTAAARLTAGAVAAVAALCALWLPGLVFLEDDEIRYAGSDYGRAQSAEAAYNNLFNPHRLYQVCGLYQMAARDLYIHDIYPLTPNYAATQEAGEEIIETWFSGRAPHSTNEMTGIFEGKNVVLVLMESVDDWLLGEHTPTINRLMEEGIQFTRFYTPSYGGIRTFNTEFCINTGNYLSSQGGYAFDYVTNSYDHSLASLLTEAGYSAKVFHYNDPGFYSRGVYSEAMGYSEYVCYADYLQGESTASKKRLLYDDQLLFDKEPIRDIFFREGTFLNFVITRSAHLSYKYNEVLSHWGLKKYPEFRGMTGNEEEDCAYLKARLVDDFFARLLQELENHGILEDTVIIGVTDHYTYGVKDEALMLARSGVDHKLWLERTPCFLWSAGGEPMEVDKTLNTADFLPTLLNLLGVQPEQPYMGRDAFDDSNEGFVPFSDGSWISGNVAFNSTAQKVLCLTEEAAPVTAEFRKEMAEQVKNFTKINNLILEMDYYARYEEDDHG